jgi:hypothetical protein
VVLEKDGKIVRKIKECDIELRRKWNIQHAVKRSKTNWRAGIAQSV